jgi:hypothetical protein
VQCGGVEPCHQKSRLIGADETHSPSESEQQASGQSTPTVLDGGDEYGTERTGGEPVNDGWQAGRETERPKDEDGQGG